VGRHNIRPVTQMSLTFLSVLVCNTVDASLQKAAEKRAIEEQAKRRDEAEAKLSVQVTALNENVATLKREWQGSQRRVSELEKQTDENGSHYCCEHSRL